MISAVLDACVLYSAPLRDLLLCLADAEWVNPFWSVEIQNEWVRNLLKNRSDLKPENLARTCREMDTHFPESLVQGYEHITATLSLPDQDDCHVLAAAIHSEADYIVTFNMRDFSSSALAPYQVKAISPDDFVLHLIQKETHRVLKVVKKRRLGLTRPSKTVEEYLTTLEKQDLPKTVAFLREHKDEI
jgi:predicted nucleic acid-binding protein